MNTQPDSAPPGQYYCPTCEKNFPIGDRCPTDGTRLVKLSVPVDPLLGRDLDGRYTISEKLGQGGMGAVYRGSQLGLGREVAIKVISSHLVSEDAVVKRFLREAKLASRLSHPNAVAVLDFGQTEDGLFYLVMELVTGRTLDAVIKAERTFKLERIVRIGAQICDALEGAHALQIVHRDLKPANIMLLTPGRDLVKVLDFGLAKSVAPDQTSTTMTNAGALLGTPAFMPPELALGEPCDGRADLYSLGVVLYLLGSGRLPFISDSVHELIAMHASEVAPEMTGVPKELGRVIDRMLRKDPKERYQTASENREALEAALEHRYMTPPAGVSIAQATPTVASLGPFPATTAQFDDLKSTPPRSHRQSAIDRLVTSDTVDAQAVPARPDTLLPTRSSTAAPTPIPTRRPKWPLVAGGGVLVVGVVSAFMIVGGGSSSPAPTPEPPSKTLPAATAPTPATPTPPPTTPTTPTTPPTTTTPPATPTTTTPLTPAATPNATVSRTHHKPGTTTVPKPGPTTKPTTPTTTSTPPATATGSAKKLPF